MNLYVIVKIPPHSNGVGKTLYLPFDAGLALYLGANLRRRWQVWYLGEFINQQRFRSTSIKPCYYYLTQRGSFVDFTNESDFHLYSELSSPDRRELMTARAITKKFPSAKVLIYCATDEPIAKIDKNILVVPWKKIAESVLA